jgi:hypothetical protein
MSMGNVRKLVRESKIVAPEHAVAFYSNSDVGRLIAVPLTLIPVMLTV